MYIRTDDNIYEGTGVKYVEGSEIVYEVKLNNYDTYIPATEVNMTCDNIIFLLDVYYIVDLINNTVEESFDDFDSAFETFEITPTRYGMLGLVTDKNNSRHIVVKFLRDRNFVFTE